MIKISKARTQRLLVVHGWSGVLLGIFLYVVLFTGAVVVFVEEISDWSTGGQHDSAGLTPPLNDTLRMLSRKVPIRYLDEVSIFRNREGYLQAFFHTHGRNEQGELRDIGIRFEYDTESDSIVSQHHGFFDQFPTSRSDALREFLVELHVNLHAPHPWGLYMTGLLGLVLLGGAVSGFLLHRHMFRDMFLMPRWSNLVLNARDRHNLAGTWGIPFALVLAITGAFFSFALSIGLPVLAMTAFGGDQEKIIEAIVGVPEEEDSTVMSLTNLDNVIDESSRRAGSDVRFMVVTNWDRADARIELFHETPEGALSANNLMFAGIDGHFIGEKPRIGLLPSAGSVAVNLVGTLHFGTFAGLASKLIWFLLGLSGCYVVITGTQLWLRRRQEERTWQLINTLLPVAVYSVPFAMCGSIAGYFLALLFGIESHWVTEGFLLCFALMFLLPFWVRQADSLRDFCRLFLGSILVAMPLLRLAETQLLWPQLLRSGDFPVIALDIAFIGAGSYYLWQVLQSGTVSLALKNAR